MLPNYISEVAARTFRDHVATWAPELEYLSKYDDFRDAEQWIKRIKAIHAKAAGITEEDD